MRSTRLFWNFIVLVCSLLASQANAESIRIQADGGPKPLNISFDEAVKFLDDKVVIRATSPVDGFPRYKGETKLLTLELLGPKSNIVNAAVIAAFPKNLDIRVDNAAFAGRLVKNVVPEWSDGFRWVGQTLGHLVETGDQSEEVIVGRKKIMLMWSPQFETFILSIKHE